MEDELAVLEPRKRRAAMDQRTLDALMAALAMLRDYKPGDHTMKDRYWAIVTTDVEKAIAVFKTFAMFP